MQDDARHDAQQDAVPAVAPGDGAVVATEADRPAQPADGPRPDRRARRASARQARAERPPSRWAEGVARWGGRVLQLYALWLLVALILRPFAREWVEGVGDVLDVLNIPAHPSLFSAILVGVVANGFLRRQRAALWFVVIVWQVPTLLVGVLALALIPVPEAEISWSDVGTLGVVSIVIAAVIVGVLLSARPAFPARIQKGAWWRALLVAVGGIVVAVAVTFALLLVTPGTLTTQADRFNWAASIAIGSQPHDIPFAAQGNGPHWLHFLAGLISAIGLVLAIAVFLRGAPSDARAEARDDLAVRRLLLEFPSDDSLEYFATRDDRATVFAPDGRAAVSYRVVTGVALAAGDPVGDPQHWDAAIDAFVDRAHRFGWTPAVISASEAGARAYARAGMSIIAMGDEAIIETRTFDLSSGAMRSVRHAAERLRRDGYSVQLRRQRDVPPAELAELVRAADAWRHGETERGFSMALDRLGSPTDPRTVVVTAHDAEGAVRGLLSFVPWGRRGLSLDVMRRSPEASSGVTELMVSTLATEGPSVAVDRVSLNFAMFREIFEQGERVSAGPVARLTRRALLLASRWWQLDSLYKSNQKYLPTWRTRYLGYPAAAQLTPVLVAAGQAEGFVPLAPRLFRRRESSPRLETPAVIERRAALVVEQEQEFLAVTAPARRLTDQERARHAKLDVLRAAGLEPYPVSVPRDHALSEVTRDLEGRTVSVSGRVVRLRDLGGVAFAVLRETNHELQVMLTADRDPAALDLFGRTVDLGDQVSVTGDVTSSRSGELTVHAASWCMAAKSLKAPPDKRKGLTDPEAKMRLRHVDLALDTTANETLRGRSRAVRALRDTLSAQGFLEVETPILQQVHGGANARPFRTHINAYDVDLYLRIAPELYLKQLAIGGIERVFELGRNFRNEGADSTHNPEFTSLEAYAAHGDYTTMRELTRELIVAAAVAVHGEPVAKRPGGVVVPLDGEWPVVGVHEAISRAAGEEITPDTPIEQVRALCDRLDLYYPESATHGALVTELYDELVEGPTQEPTFYVDFPVETSPLTRVHRRDPRLAERWDLVAFGAELGTAYSELVDPVDQRRRLTEQSLLAAAGDPEAMEVDEAFLSALEFAMPPTGGLGIGVDRVYMMLIGASIRETLAFPFVKPSTRR